MEIKLAVLVHPGNIMLCLWQRAGGCQITQSMLCLLHPHDWVCLVWVVSKSRTRVTNSDAKRIQKQLRVNICCFESGDGARVKMTDVQSGSSQRSHSIVSLHHTSVRLNLGLHFKGGLWG